jgi:KDO2-lipid IV(A) lauroyltransferase
MKENIAAYIYFAGWRIVRWLPERAAYTLAYLLADFVTKRNGKKISRLRSNLRRTQPSMTAILV